VIGTKEKLGMGVPYLFYAIHVKLHRVVGFFGFLHQRNNKKRAPFHIRVHNRSPSLPPCHTGQIDVAIRRAQSPFAVSGMLHGLDGEKAKAPGMPRIIPGAGSEPSLQFSSME
jgi:hypothetical protein